MKFRGVNHLAMVTGDMDKTVRFYRDVLGTPLVAATGNRPGGLP
jgi:catechol 2,3-dioxygenase-like lactoylglutathione lyase family enzyme